MNNEHIVGRIEQLTDKPSAPQRDWKDINAQPTIGPALETLKGESTPAPEDWEMDFALLWGIAPEGSLKAKKGEEIANFISRLLASEKAAARREGAERAVEYIGKKMSMWMTTELDDASILRQLPDILAAARSEGVNG